MKLYDGGCPVTVKPTFFVVESKKVLLFEFVGSNYLFALNLKLF